MKIVVALTLTLLAWQSEPPRPSAHADSGGKQIDSSGVQLSLAVSSAPYRPGELPPLEAYLKNVASDTITFSPSAVTMGNIEIDGVWHNAIYAGSCCAGRERLPPNATSRSLPIRISRDAVRGPDGPVDIPPGRHKMRLRTAPSEFMSIDRPGRRGIILVSNAVDINVR